MNPQRTSRRPLFPALLFALLLALPSVSYGSFIALSPDHTTYGYPFIDAVNGGIIFVNVMLGVSPGPGIKQVRFAVPTPSGLFLAETSPSPGSGTIETGAVYDLTGCGTGDRFVVTLVYLVNAVNSCTPLLIRPYSGNNVEGLDCNGNVVILDRENVTLRPPGFPGCGAPTVPSNPSPPDGATNVSLSPSLFWESEPTAGTGLGVFEMRLYFGTNPNPPIVDYYAYPPHSVGPLAPGTTYYWKIFSVASDYGDAEGPIWRFTTGAPVTARKTTWGSVKALYRE